MSNQPIYALEPVRQRYMEAVPVPPSHAELTQILEEEMPELLEEAIAVIGQVLRSPSSKQSAKLAAAKLVLELAKYHADL